MTKSKMFEILKENNIHVSDISISKKSNEIILMKSFFYTMGNTSQKFAEDVMFKLSNNFELVNHYKKFVPFRGGDSVKKGSHFGVVIKEKINE